MYVRLHSGRGGLRTARFPLDTATKDLQEWIDDQVTDYRRRHPRPLSGTLAADVAQQYLPSLVNRPRLQADRKYQLAWWCERFGSRARWSLKPLELETALNELAAGGAAASTVKKYRTALYHLFTKLDGKNAPNPLRDVPPPREPEPLPRALPRTVIASILAAIPDHRFRRGLDAQQVAEIRLALKQPHVNVSALARTYGISEAMIRKLRDRPRRRREDRSVTRAGLRVMAELGWSPAMIRAFQPADYDAASRSVLARGRSKGDGSRAVRLPLTPEGAAAIEAWIALGPPASVNVTSWLRAWRRGVDRWCATLEAAEDTRALGVKLRRELASSTPYSLRHSFLTDVQLATGNIHATQQYALHEDPRMTRRYTLAAVAPELLSASERLIEWRQRTANEPTTTAAENRGNAPHSADSTVTVNRANTEAKRGKSSRK